MFPTASPDALDLLQKLLALESDKRITAAEALAHKYVEQFHMPDVERNWPSHKPPAWCAPPTRPCRPTRPPAAATDRRLRAAHPRGKRSPCCASTTALRPSPDVRTRISSRRVASCALVAVCALFFVVALQPAHQRLGEAIDGGLPQSSLPGD